MIDRDGIDGPWSTTHLHIGSPRQDLRVLVSTAGQETWVVLPQGCDGSELGNNCAGSRGRIFDSRSSISWQNASSVWNNSGIYQLGTVIGYDLGLTGVGILSPAPEIKRLLSCSRMDSMASILSDSHGRQITSRSIIRSSPASRPTRTGWVKLASVQDRQTSQ